MDWKQHPPTSIKWMNAFILPIFYKHNTVTALFLVHFLIFFLHEFLHFPQFLSFLNYFLTLYPVNQFKHPTHICYGHISWSFFNFYRLDDIVGLSYLFLMLTRWQKFPPIYTSYIMVRYCWLCLTIIWEIFVGGMCVRYFCHTLYKRQCINPLSFFFLPFHRILRWQDMSRFCPRGKLLSHITYNNTITTLSTVKRKSKMKKKTELIQPQ